jgi:DNA-binding transcriptional ArsR family regulator
VRIPAGFRQWCHGYVVTSHKAQGRTHQHVIVSAEWLDAKSAYVACSRGKISCTIHTPDKARLLQRLPEGTRRAALDALSESVGQSPEVAAIKAGISAAKNSHGTATEQIGEQPKRRWSERIRRRIMETIDVVRRHRFIAERRGLALKMTAKQTQSQHQNQHAQKQGTSVRIHI